MQKILENDKKTAFLTKGYFDNLKLLEKCVKEVEPELDVRPKIIICGKECNQNRNVGFFSNESIGYKYSNSIAKSKPLGKYSKRLLKAINKKFGSNYNGILINKYIDGSDNIGAHSDDESGLDDCGVVAISFGATRKFRIRNKSDKKIVLDVDVDNGSILHMGGDFQKVYTHEVPVQKKIKETRYSFTFRKHKI